MIKDKGILLLVQANIAAEGEDAFNEYYYTHIPRLLKVRGYLWGQRYLALHGDRRYVALYQIESADYFDKLLGPDNSKRHPITLSDWKGWDALPIRDSRINVYEQTFGTPLRAPLLSSDRPLVLEMVDVAADKEREWNQRYISSRMPNLLKVKGLVMGGLFQLVEHPALARFEGKPKYLAVYELENEDVIASVIDKDKMTPNARAEFDNWEKYCRSVGSSASLYAYRIISKHWRFEGEP
jgi:hypothetical protein